MTSRHWNLVGSAERPTAVAVHRRARETRVVRSCSLVGPPCSSETQTPVPHPRSAGAVPGDGTEPPPQSPCRAAPESHRPTTSRAPEDHTRPLPAAASFGSLSLSHLLPAAAWRDGSHGPREGHPTNLPRGAAGDRTQVRPTSKLRKLLRRFLTLCFLLFCVCSHWFIKSPTSLAGQRPSSPPAGFRGPLQNGCGKQTESWDKTLFPQHAEPSRIQTRPKRGTYRE